MVPAGWTARLAGNMGVEQGRMARAASSWDPEEQGVKKGRHRRFEEARSLKRSLGSEARACPECGAEPEDSHASWCLAEEDAYDRILGSSPTAGADEHDPLDDEPV
jgi:hypothetical protein